MSVKEIACLLETMKDTQERQVLVHLATIGEITPMDALKDYGCFRLSARIYRLRNLGVPIKTTIRYQNGKQFAVYSLEDVA